MPVPKRTILTSVTLNRMVEVFVLAVQASIDGRMVMPIRVSIKVLAVITRKPLGVGIRGILLTTLGQRISVHGHQRKRRYGWGRISQRKRILLDVVVRVEQVGTQRALELLREPWVSLNGPDRVSTHNGVIGSLLPAPIISPGKKTFWTLLISWFVTIVIGLPTNQAGFHFLVVVSSLGLGWRVPQTLVDSPEVGKLSPDCLDRIYFGRIGARVTWFVVLIGRVGIGRDLL